MHENNIKLNKIKLFSDPLCKCIDKVDPMFYFERVSYRLVMSTMLQGSLGMLMYEARYYVIYYTVFRNVLVRFFDDHD